MKIYIFLVAAAILFSGCVSSKSQPSCAIKGTCHTEEKPNITPADESDDNLKIPAFPYKPIIGTRNNDAKTVVDTGVVLKIYIPSYKDNKKMLVAGHDRYVWAKEPGFVLGAEKPEVRKRTGMMTAAGKVPFVYGQGEIDSASIQNNTKIRDYLDNVAEAEKRDTVALDNLETGESKFDNVIKKYVEKTKEGK